jgi:nucleoside-diphosphate-sugar epimerase
MIAPVQVSLLLTGAGGWLGASLLDLLEEGHLKFPSGQAAVVLGPSDPVALDSRWSAHALVYRGNLTDADFLATLPMTTSLVHAAAVIHPHPKPPRLAPRDLFADNLVITRAVLSRVLPAGRVVLVSSIAARGPDGTASALSGYGRSKYACEQFLRDLARENSLSAVVLRACWFHGRNAPQRQLRFDRLARSGRFPVFSGPARRRSVSAVDDVAKASLAALRIASPVIPVLYVLDPTPYTMGELLHARLGPSHSLPPRLPRFLLGLLYHLDSWLKRRGGYLPVLHALGELSLDLSVDRELATEHRKLLGLGGCSPLADLIADERRSTV